MINYYGNDIPWVPSLDKSGKPLYVQIAESIEKDIASGLLPYGSRLPPQRIIAGYLNITHSTVTRAYQLCEERGLIKGTIGRGTFVCSAAGVPQDLLEQNKPRTIEMGAVLPLYEINSLAESSIRNLFPLIDFPGSLRYSPPEGYPKHRQIAANWLQGYGIRAGFDNILITSGSQNAISVLMMGVFSRGDRIAVDLYVYPEFKNLASYLGIILIPIRGDPYGMLPDELALACQRDKIKGVYLIPEHQNPTGITMPMSRRAALAAIIRQNDLLLIEDGMFHFIKGLRAPVSSLIPERSFYIHGTTKALVPSLRIAYLCAPQPYVPTLIRVLHNLLWLTSPLNAELMSLMIANGEYDRILMQKLDRLRQRNEICQEILQDYLEDTAEPAMFRYLVLPHGWDDTEIERDCLSHGVQIFGNKRFAVGSAAGESALRIALSSPESPEQLRHGLEIIRNVLIEHGSSRISF